VRSTGRRRRPDSDVGITSTHATGAALSRAGKSSPGAFFAIPDPGCLRLMIQKPREAAAGQPHSCSHLVYGHHLCSCLGHARYEAARPRAGARYLAALPLPAIDHGGWRMVTTARGSYGDALSARSGTLTSGFRPEHADLGTISVNRQAAEIPGRAGSRSPRASPASIATPRAAQRADTDGRHHHRPQPERPVRKMVRDRRAAANA